MIIDILTIFPDFFSSPLRQSLIDKAIKKGVIQVNIHNIRDFATDKHRVVDDSPFGGGAGMVMKVEPIYNALRFIEENRGERYKILLTPRGKTLNQEKVVSLSKREKLVFICGRYEGVDERILNFVDEEISIGDYILMGGEAAALVLLEAVVRLVPSVVGRGESVDNETFNQGLLEYPQYTRPERFMGFDVPEVLLSGNHKKIKEWRLYQSLLKTYKNRPDLLEKAELTDEMKKMLQEIVNKYAS